MRSKDAPNGILLDPVGGGHRNQVVLCVYIYIYKRGNTKKRIASENSNNHQLYAQYSSASSPNTASIITKM